MTIAPACPTPPLDFALRPLPIRTIDLAQSPLVRIHDAAFGPIYYRRPSSELRYRFDAYDGNFGVMYVGFSLEAAFFETVVRDRFHNGTLPLLIDERAFTSRFVSYVTLDTVRPLRLADFTVTLAPLGGDGSILTTSEYLLANQWSSAIYSHPQNVDGILYESKYSSMECAAIFDRSRIVPIGTACPLTQALGLPDILDRWNIGIAPNLV